MLKKIWHDPVWSKVIATGIIALFGTIWAGVHFDWWSSLLSTYLTPVWLLFLLIALTLFSFTLFLWKQHQLGEMRKESAGPELEPKIATIDVAVPPVDKGKSLTYPLKCHVQLRNDSSMCVDVRVSEYRPNTVTVKKFVVDVLQIKLGTWLPNDYPVDRLAVLPGQMFRAWIAIDDTKFNESQINLLRGRIGTLVLVVNGKHVNIDL